MTNHTYSLTDSHRLRFSRVRSVALAVQAGQSVQDLTGPMRHRAGRMVTTGRGASLDGDVWWCGREVAVEGWGPEGWCSVEDLVRRAFARAPVVMANEAHSALAVSTDNEMTA